AEGFFPRREDTALVRPEVQIGSDAIRDDLRSVIQRRRADEPEQVELLCAGVIPIPVLMLLAEVDRVEEISGGLSNLSVLQRAHVWNRHRLDRRLLQEHQPQGCVRIVRELLELFEGW